MNEEFLEPLSSLLAAEAKFLVIGAYAVGVHGRPRARKDLDVWIEASPANAARVLDALMRFGAPIGDLIESDLDHVRLQDFADVAVLERIARAGRKLRDQ